MRRILASLILITTFAIVAATRTRRLIDPGHDASHFDAARNCSDIAVLFVLIAATQHLDHAALRLAIVQNPGSQLVAVHPGTRSRDRPQRRRHLRRAAGLALHRRQERDQRASLLPISTPTARSDRAATSATWLIPRRIRIGTPSLVRRRRSRATSISIIRPGVSTRSGGRLRGASFSRRIRLSASSEPAIILTRATRATTRPSKSTARRFSA